eukprot:TRINITY_DN315_c0_g1_i4.p1 TRINITY_DN315_c0_g1~~TRINITY_DN315_c0_g1_i4.p1  ORF type:complete len:417 (+),score=95.78 TRINITY_DN315_c0_g1_i4:104-1354(+)
MSASSSSSSKSSVVILGAGYAGVALAKDLQKDKSLNVTLVDPRDHFYHAIGVPRAFADASFARQNIAWPLNRIFRDGRDASNVVQAAADSIDPEKQTVTLSDGQVLSYDALVVAIGARNRGALKERAHWGDVRRFFQQPYARLWNHSISITHNNVQGAAVKALEERAASIAAASKIVVVGGGAVGVESAAEIARSNASAEVVLVHNHTVLLESSRGPPVYPAKFHKKLDEKLAAIPNLTVLRGESVVRDDNDDHQTLRLASGQEIANVDVVLWAIGTDFEESAQLLSPFERTRGGVKVDAQLRAEGFDNIFVAGDLADVADERKLAISAGEHAHHVAQNIRRLFQKRSLAAYVPNRRGGTGLTSMNVTNLIVVPLGKGSGVGVLVGNMVVGSRLAHALKGKDYLVSKTQSQFGFVK